MTASPPALTAFGARLPTSEEVDSAADALTAIESGRNTDGTLSIGEAVLSTSLVGLITELLGIVARGETATLTPLSRRLTTQEAADLLNISRPHLIKLLERGKIAYEMAGTHRRLPLKDVLDYKAKRSAGRREALQEMQEIAEDLDSP